MALDEQHDAKSNGPHDRGISDHTLHPTWPEAEEDLAVEEAEGRRGGGAVGKGLGGLAALDAGEWYIDAAGGPALRLDDAPAARTAGKALLLLFPGLRRRVHQAEDLIERLAGLRVAVDKPADTIVRAGVAVASPVDAVARMLAQGKVHRLA